MPVKLIDLQLIYGVAGAREKFEDLASHLVKGEQPAADKVRVMQGDGGIDVHVGELTSPDGIEVYQCKFFQHGLDEAQKDQIRKSFQGCRDSDEFRTKKWTLCLPLDLSIEERKWFEQWRAKQMTSGIVIEDPWGATKLEGLLYQAKNQGLRESFFQEEHLAQIRELHAMLSQLISDIAERLRQDTAERGQGERARKAEKRAKIQELTREGRSIVQSMTDAKVGSGSYESDIEMQARVENWKRAARAFVRQNFEFSSPSFEAESVADFRDSKLIPGKPPHWSHWRDQIEMRIRKLERLRP